MDHLNCSEVLETGNTESPKVHLYFLVLVLSLNSIHSDFIFHHVAEMYEQTRCVYRVSLYAIWHEISLCDQLSNAICREESCLPELLMGQSFCQVIWCWLILALMRCINPVSCIITAGKMYFYSRALALFLGNLSKRMENWIVFMSQLMFLKCAFWFLFIQNKFTTCKI